MKGNKGAALITVIMTMMILSILSLAAAGLIQTRYGLAVSRSDRNGAFYAAQGGIEEMKLNIENRINEYRGSIIDDVLDYVQMNYGKPGYDPEGYSMLRTRYYIFDTYLKNNQFGRDMQVSDAAYITQLFSDADYDSDESAITVMSTGSYGAGSNPMEYTITAVIKLEGSPVQFETGQSGGGGSTEGTILDYPIIVSGPDVSSVSIDMNCASLMVNGAVNLPRSMGSFRSEGVYTFNGGATFNNNLSLNAYAIHIIVNGDLKIRGNLTFSANSEMILEVNNGDLCVDGNITMNGYNGRITVNGGNIRCNGNIRFNSQSEISTDMDLYMTGQISHNKKASYTIDYDELIYGFGADIQYENFSFGDISVLNAYSNNPSFIKTNKITTDLGTPQEPVIIYNNGNIQINNPWDNNEFNIYGIVYSTGTINIDGYGTDGGIVNVYGVLISSKKVDINQYHKRVRVEADAAGLSGLLSAYPDVSEFFGYSGGGGQSIIENVNIVSGFKISDWDE